MIENEFLKVVLSSTTGLPSKLIDKVSGRQVAINEKVPGHNEVHIRAGALFSVIIWIWFAPSFAVCRVQDF